MMLGASIGVNMLKTDPKLWVPVGPAYQGFVFQPSKGWLDATAKTTNKHSGRDQKASGTNRSTATTTTNVCAETKLWRTKTLAKACR